MILPVPQLATFLGPQLAMTPTAQLARALMLACACAWLAAGCGASDADGPVGGGDAAAAGDSDAVGSGGGDVSADGAGAGSSGDASGDGVVDLDVAGSGAGPGDAGPEQDLEYVHDIAEWVDLAWLFDAEPSEDSAGGPAPDSGGDGLDEADVSGVDAGLVDVPLADGAVADGAVADGAVADGAGDTQAEPGDVPADPDATAGADDGMGPGDGDAGPGYDTFFDECEELGIPSDWEGTFSGDIAYDIDSGGLVYPEQGLLAASGDLTFSISCIESKLVVEGQLSGSANIEGQGDFPYSFNLLGFYNPTTGELNADLIDGVAVVYGLVEIYFEGTFDGALDADQQFSGAWTGSALGTNLAFITGDAEGDGVWAATAAN